MDNDRAQAPGICAPAGHDPRVRTSPVSPKRYTGDKILLTAGIDRKGIMKHIIGRMKKGETPDMVCGAGSSR